MANTLQDTSIINTSVLTIEKAVLHNYKHLGDFLSLLPGIWIRDMGSIGLISSGRFRGSRQNHLCLLLDGQPISDPWSGICDFTLIPTEMIERIEIYPSLNPFGINSIGAIISIIQTDTISPQPYSKFYYRTGSNSFSDLDIAFHQNINANLKMTSGALLKNYAKTKANDTYRAQKMRTMFQYTPVQNISITYKLLFNKYDKDLPYSFSNPYDTLSLYKPHLKTLRYDHSLKNIFYAFGIETQMELNYTALSYEIRDTDFTPKYLFPVRNTSFSIKQIKNCYSAILRWGFSTTQRQLKTPDGLQFKDHFNHGFFQGAFPLFRLLNLTLQTSLHTSPNTKHFLLGSCQLQRKLKSMNFWMAYHSGIYDPSLGERFGYIFSPSVPITIDQYNNWWHQLNNTPNLDLKSEQSKQIEAGFIFLLGHLFNTKTTLYSRNIQNSIQWANIDDGQFVNMGHTKIIGLETELKAGPYCGFYGTLTANLLKAKDHNENDLLELPNVWGTGSVHWQHIFFNNDLDLNLCLSSRTWSETWSLFSIYGDSLLDSYIKPNYFIDFKINMTIMKNFKFIYEIDNILNSNAFLVSGFWQPGKTSRIGFRWELFN